MKLIFLCLICLLTSIINQPIRFQGTYAYSSGKAPYAPSGLLEIHYVNQNKILFYLEAERASDHNSGSIYGKLTLNKKSGNYEYLPVEKGGCKLVFIKDGNKVVVKTVDGDCGFGYGVYADGTFSLKDGSNPAYLITRTNKKVYFDKTSPENFRED